MALDVNHRILVAGTRLRPLGRNTQMQSGDKFRALLILLPIIATSFLIVSAMSWWFNQRPNGIQRRIAAEAIATSIRSHVSPGATKAVVARYLTDLGSHGPDPDGGPYLIAWVDYKRPLIFLNSHAIVAFKFSKAHRLVSYRVGTNDLQDLSQGN